MAWRRTNKQSVIFLCSPGQWCAVDVDMSCWAFCDALIIFFGGTFWKILFVGPIPGRKSVGKYENEYAGAPTLLPSLYNTMCRYMKICIHYSGVLDWIRSTITNKSSQNTTVYHTHVIQHHYIHYLVLPIITLHNTCGTRIRHIFLSTYLDSF